MASKYLLRPFSIFVNTASRNFNLPNALLNTAPKSLSTNFVSRFSSSQDIPIVTYEQVKELPKHPKVLLIDVREPQELQETGKIPTSINIPLSQVATELSPSLDEKEFKLKYSREKPTKDTDIIFHCRIGKRSHSAAETAKSLGYKNVKNYLGSWLEWADKEGLPK